MAKFKYKPGSWVKIKYHLKHSTGCSLKYYSARIDPNRGWISNPEYTLTVIPIIAIFKIKWLHGDVISGSLPLSYAHEHLRIDGETDYKSFTSLN